MDVKQTNTNSAVVEKKKKPVWIVRLLKWLFPWKGDSVKTIVFKVLFLLALAAFIFGAVQLGSYYWEKYQSESEYDDIRSIALPQVDEDGNVIVDEGLNFEALRQMNANTMGWITVPGTSVDYPVVQTTDNDYYLTHIFNGNYSTVGTPYIDYRCAAGDTLAEYGDNTIIYGHNIRAGTMFSDLTNYKSLGFYQANPYITYFTADGEEHKLKIIATFTMDGLAVTNSQPENANGDDFAYHNFVNAGNEDLFYNYVNEIALRSFYLTDVDVEYGDKLMTLSTCDYDFDDQRLVVVARFVREGESEEVNVNGAYINPSVYLPQRYCDRYGLTQNTYDPNFSYYTRKD